VKYLTKLIVNLINFVKNNNLMNIQAVKRELIEMISREGNHKSLLAIKNILLSSSEIDTDVATIKEQLAKSQKQFRNGEGVDYENILKESEEKYFPR
jgi:hypothetical protein